MNGALVLWRAKRGKRPILAREPSLTFQSSLAVAPCFSFKNTVRLCTMNQPKKYWLFCSLESTFSTDYVFIDPPLESEQVLVSREMASFFLHPSLRSLFIRSREFAFDTLVWGNHFCRGVVHGLIVTKTRSIKLAIWMYESVKSGRKIYLRSETTVKIIWHSLE